MDKNIKLGFHTAPWRPQSPEAFLEAVEEIAQTTVYDRRFDGFELVWGDYFRNYIESYGGSDEFKENIERKHLEVSTVYVGGLTRSYDESQKGSITSAATFARDIDCTYLLGDGGMDIEKHYAPDSVKQFAHVLNEIGRRVGEEYGLIFALHTHSGSPLHYPLPAGESQRHVPLNITCLRDHVDSDYVGLCPDTAQLSPDGVDLPKLFDTWEDAVKCTHFKDRDARQRFTELGTGVIPKATFEELVAKLEKANYKGYVVCDMDYCNQKPTPAENCKANLKFLVELGL